MKTLHRLLAPILALAALVAIIAPPAARATDLTYTTLPTTADNFNVLQNKALAASNSTKSANITTATTTTVKSGSGILERIIVNTGGSGSSFTIYDNTAGSGTKIGTGTSATQIVLTYGCRFATGLTVVTASGTPADITVIYR